MAKKRPDLNDLTIPKGIDAPAVAAHPDPDTAPAEASATVPADAMAEVPAAPSTAPAAVPAEDPAVSFSAVRAVLAARDALPDPSPHRYAHTLSLRMTADGYRRLRRYVANVEERTEKRITHQAIIETAIDEYLTKNGG
jgi:hypothetical protein